MVKVTQYLRKPGKQAHSIERLYEDVRAHMPSDIQVKPVQNRFVSQGLLTRMYDIIRASRLQGDVNHVTGDIHYVTYLLNKKRTILTIHDFVTLERLHGLKRWLFWFLWYWLPEKRCAAITVVSDSTRNQVFRHLKCDPNKVQVIYNNVSEEFQPAPKPFNAESPRILQVGTNPNKNIPRVAQALAGLPCTLVIIGRLTGEQTEFLKDLNIAYENHINLSRQALLAQYLQCDMLVFASTYEGFGLPIIEANAVGRPVVTSNCWSMPEVANNAACLVDPLNPSSIRQGIRKIIEDADYREDLIRKGFENVKRFRVESIAEQYAQLYREVSRI